MDEADPVIREKLPGLLPDACERLDTGNGLFNLSGGVT